LNDTPADVSYFIDTIHYGPSAGSTASTFDPAVPYTDPTRTESINDYFVSISGAGAVANSSENQGENDVVVLSLTFSGTGNDEAVDKEIATVTVQSVGDRDADIASLVVRLHWDANTNGTYESGTDLQVATGTLSGGQAVLTTTPTDVNARFNSAAKQYLLVVNVDIDATIGNTIGLEISNPSTDITFRDALDDPGTWLNASSEYDQIGYITTTSITWTTNTFTVTPAPDLTDPSIVTTTPSSGATNIDPETSIEIVFDQYMLDGTGVNGIENPANVKVEVLFPAGPVTTTLDYSGLVLIITPVAPDFPLDWATTYKVKIEPNVEDVDGQVIGTLNPGGYEMTFTTRPEFPEVNAPTVLKNRIGSGANDEAVILIPTPSSGSFSGLSVKVFTTTGRLVKTFGGAEIETISSGRKILWDGTNDQGSDLGPGMYFVQVRVAGRKNVLKVMIVR
jgi:hypothetical protein